MDTVCEEEMACTGELGGVGIIHRLCRLMSENGENVKEDSSFIVGAAVGTDHGAVIRSQSPCSIRCGSSGTRYCSRACRTAQ